MGMAGLGASSENGQSMPMRATGTGTDCVASLDPRLSVVAANEDFFEQFGRTSADVCGRSVYELLHPGTPAVLDPHFARLAEGRHTWFAERVLGTRGADNTFAGNLTGVAVLDEADQLSAIVVMMSPDTAVEMVREQLPRASRYKPLLTRLDARILEGIAAGASTVQLAGRMYMSKQGVEYHVGTMMRKLNGANRAALVSRAYSMGVLIAGSWPPRVTPGVCDS
jgi:DNA-binding CsgD family transcriptional regulator